MSTSISSRPAQRDEGLRGLGLRLRVTRVAWEAEGVVSIRLSSTDGQPLPVWAPGAHIDLQLPSGLVRQYSLCGDPSDSANYEVAVRLERDGRGGSAEIHNSALVSRTLVASAIRNHFELKDADRYLFIAGGIGITPLLPMMREVARRGAPWSLLYCGHGRATMPFLPGVTALEGGAVRIVDTTREPRPDLTGVVAGLAANAVVYCCGPNSLLDAVSDVCERAGVACETEHFSAGTAAAEPDAGGEVELELRRSGLTVTAEPDTTLLEAIRNAGVDIESDCEEGYCGTCETVVLEGTPDHHDVVLSKAERAAGRTFFPCVSRACSRRLVLDI